MSFQALTVELTACVVLAESLIKGAVSARVECSSTYWTTCLPNSDLVYLPRHIAKYWFIWELLISITYEFQDPPSLITSPWHMDNSDWEHRTTDLNLPHKLFLDVWKNIQKGDLFRKITKKVKWRTYRCKEPFVREHYELCYTLWSAFVCSQNGFLMQRLKPMPGGGSLFFQTCPARPTPFDIPFLKRQQVNIAPGQNWTPRLWKHKKTWSLQIICPEQVKSGWSDILQTRYLEVSPARTESSQELSEALKVQRHNYLDQKGKSSRAMIHSS